MDVLEKYPISIKESDGTYIITVYEKGESIGVPRYTQSKELAKFKVEIRKKWGRGKYLNMREVREGVERIVNP